jgi:hypothetical protein
MATAISGLKEEKAVKCIVGYWDLGGLKIDFGDFGITQKLLPTRRNS